MKILKTILHAETDIPLLTLCLHFLTGHLEKLADLLQREGQLHFLDGMRIGQDTQYLQAFTVCLDKGGKLVPLDHDVLTLIFHSSYY